jgi:hypothetical protein
MGVVITVINTATSGNATARVAEGECSTPAYRDLFLAGIFRFYNFGMKELEIL